MRRREHVAWAAGLIDGEGHITIKRNRFAGHEGLYPQIVVTMTSRQAVVRLAEIFGVGTVTPEPRPPRKTAYRWFIQERSAVIRIIREIEPHLVVKRWEAALAIGLLINPDLTTSQREEFYEEMRAAKCRTHSGRRAA